MFPQPGGANKGHRAPDLMPPNGSRELVGEVHDHLCRRLKGTDAGMAAPEGLSPDRKRIFFSWRGRRCGSRKRDGERVATFGAFLCHLPSAFPPEALDFIGDDGHMGERKSLRGFAWERTLKHLSMVCLEKTSAISYPKSRLGQRDHDLE